MFTTGLLNEGCRGMKVDPVSGTRPPPPSLDLTAAEAAAAFGKGWTCGCEGDGAGPQV